MIRPGMHLRDIVNQAIDTGIYQEPAEGREAFIFGGLKDKPVADYELSGDIHHRVIRSRTDDGDHVVLRLDITEIVRQRRAAEQAQNRLVDAINAFPDPFVIYDKDMRLVI